MPVEVVEMTSSWRAPAQRLIESRDAGWLSLWALLDLAGHAAIRLSLSAPLGSSVDLTFAALDLGEAREELEWARPSLRSDSSHHPLPALYPDDDTADARRVLEELVDEAARRLLAAGGDNCEQDEVSTLGRAFRRIVSAQDEFRRCRA